MGRIIGTKKVVEATYSQEEVNVLLKENVELKEENESLKEANEELNSKVDDLNQNIMNLEKKIESSKSGKKEETK